MNKLAPLLALALFSFGCCCKEDSPLRQDGIYIDARIHEDFDETYLAWMKDPRQIEQYEARIQHAVRSHIPHWPEDNRVEVPDSWVGATHLEALRSANQELEAVVGEISAGQLTTEEGREVDVTYVILNNVEYCIYAAQLYLADADAGGGSGDHAGEDSGAAAGESDDGGNTASAARDGDDDPGILPIPFDCPQRDAFGEVEMNAGFWIYAVLKVIPEDEVPAP